MENSARNNCPDGSADDTSAQAVVSHPDTCQNYENVLDTIALGIQTGKTVEETTELFQDSAHFHKAVQNWRDPQCSLNLLQWAIVYKRCDFVKLFYGQFRPCLFESYIHAQDVEPNTFLNFPVHLACWVGHLPVLKFLLTCQFGGVNAVMEAVSIINLHQTTTDPLMYNVRDMTENCPRGKPFELAVANDHLPCVQFLLDNVVLQSTALHFVYGAVREPSQLLHRACSVGCGQLVELVLKNSFKDVLCLNDKNGKTPLHTAVWNGDTRSIGLLLNNGADVNACTEAKQNCLHILYRSKVHACYCVNNTELLLEHGIDHSAVDAHGKTPLHVLAEEIALTDSMTLRLWSQVSEAISSVTSSKDIGQKAMYTVDMYQADLLQCLRLLLEHGANSSLQTFHGCGNGDCFSCGHYRNALEVLMDKVTNNCLKNAQFFYDAVSLLLISAERHTKNLQEFVMAAFTHFVSHKMHKIEDKEIQVKLIHLFFHHACCTDITVPLAQVMKSLVHHSCDLSCIHLVANYMPMAHLQQLGEGVMKKHILPLLESADEKHLERGQELMAIFGEASPHSLRHTCKLFILRHLCHRGTMIEILPLPDILKKYLASDMF